MKIIKRNGSEVPFDITKIITAVTKASDSVGGKSRLTREQINQIADDVTEQCQALNRAVSVEEIQDMVENKLMDMKAHDIARHYITYRYIQSLKRQTNTTDERILSLIECQNEEVKQENANKNPTVNSVQRDYMAGEISKDLTARLLLDPEIVKAHQEGLIHFHDSCCHTIQEVTVMRNHQYCPSKADQIFLAGSAVGGEQIEMAQALENDQIYAWRGALKAGNLYIPLTFEGEQAMAIVPEIADSHDIEDGQLSTFGQVLISKVDKQYWTIPADGTYRIVLNKEEKSITIYSTATDLKPLTVSFNNTELGKNPWSQEVNVLHMYGGFNSFAYDSGIDEETGKSFKYCQVKYNLIQSVANPKVFVYKGDVLPRNEYKDNYGKTNAGWVNFSTLRYANNGWFVGSTADAVRNSYNGYTTVTAGKIEGAVTGQGNNRYAYFLIPEGCNYVVVDLENNTVLFDIK